MRVLLSAYGLRGGVEPVVRLAGTRRSAAGVRAAGLPGGRGI